MEVIPLTPRSLCKLAETRPLEALALLVCTNELRAPGSGTDARTQELVASNSELAGTDRAVGTDDPPGGLWAGRPL